MVFRIAKGDLWEAKRIGLVSALRLRELRRDELWICCLKIIYTHRFMCKALVRQCKSKGKDFFITGVTSRHYWKQYRQTGNPQEMPIAMMVCELQ